MWGSPEYQRQWRRNHPERCLAHTRKYRDTHRELVKARRSERGREFCEWIHILTATHDCVLCGGVAEHWHHVDPSSKRTNVAAMNGYSLDSIEAELEKCVPMCRVCHGTYHSPPGGPQRGGRKCAS